MGAPYGGCGIGHINPDTKTSATFLFSPSNSSSTPPTFSAYVVTDLRVWYNVHANFALA